MMGLTIAPGRPKGGIPSSSACSTVGAVGQGSWAIGGPYSTQSGEPCGWSTVDDDEGVRAIRTGVDLSSFVDRHIWGA